MLIDLQSAFIFLYGFFVSTYGIKASPAMSCAITILTSLICSAFWYCREGSGTLIQYLISVSLPVLCKLVLLSKVLKVCFQQAQSLNLTF